MKKKWTRDAIGQGEVSLLDIKKYEEAKLIYNNPKKSLQYQIPKNAYGYMVGKL